MVYGKTLTQSFVEQIHENIDQIRTLARARETGHAHPLNGTCPECEKPLHGFKACGIKSLGFQDGETVVYCGSLSCPEYDAPDGLVRDTRELAARPGDMVICRNNAPLVPAAYALLRAGVPCKIQGRDIAAGLIALVKKLRATSIDDLLERLPKWQMREQQVLLKRYSKKPTRLDAQLQQLNDKVATITELAAGKESLQALMHGIQDLFADVKGAHTIVLLSTIHKAKDLEAPRVWWLRSMKERDGAQEDNLKYVATTRAKQELVTVLLED